MELAEESPWRSWQDPAVGTPTFDQSATQQPSEERGDINQTGLHAGKNLFAGEPDWRIQRPALLSNTSNPPTVLMARTAAADSKMVRPKLDFVPMSPSPTHGNAGSPGAVPKDLDWTNANPGTQNGTVEVRRPGRQMTEQEEGFAEIGENHNLGSLQELEQWDWIEKGQRADVKPLPRPVPSHAEANESRKADADRPTREPPGSGITSDASATPMTPGAEKGKSRKEMILGILPGNVKIAPNPDAKADAPSYEATTLGVGAVAAYEDDIAYAARIKGMDADLIKAIMFMEMSHGWYDPSGLGVPYSLLPTSKSILPMNLNADYWGEAFGSKAELSMSRINVVSGAEMLRRIEKLAPGAGIAEIATLYNNINATKVSDYGARVAQIYKDKPWEYLTKSAERKGAD